MFLDWRKVATRLISLHLKRQAANRRRLTTDDPTIQDTRGVCLPPAMIFSRRCISLTSFCISSRFKNHEYCEAAVVETLDGRAQKWMGHAAVALGCPAGTVRRHPVAPAPTDRPEHHESDGGGSGTATTPGTSRRQCSALRVDEVSYPRGSARAITCGHTLYHHTTDVLAHASDAAPEAKHQ